MSMKPPPSDQDPGKGCKPEDHGYSKKAYPKMSTIGSGFYRALPIYCLCYSCGEILINDTVINTLLCPHCPSTQPMMNFPDFDRAMKESYRALELSRKRLQGMQGSPGGAAGGAA